MADHPTWRVGQFYGTRGVVVVVLGTAVVVVVGRGATVVVGRTVVGTCGVGGRPLGSVVGAVVGNGTVSWGGVKVVVVVSIGGGGASDGGGAETDDFRLSSSIDAVYNSWGGTPASAARM